MKYLLTISFFMGSLLICLAQGDTMQTLLQFTELKVYDRITVHLVKGEKNKLTIAAKDKNEVKILQNNGVLKIKRSSDQLISRDAIDILLYYTESLTVLDANENAKITSKGPVESPKIEIKAQAAGYIVLELASASTIIKSASGSEVSLTGTSKVQDVTVNTGGKVYNKGLFTKETTVRVLAGGHAEIHGSDKVIAKVKAGGVILVYGDPKSLEKENTFGGKIESMN